MKIGFHQVGVQTVLFNYTQKLKTEKPYQTLKVLDITEESVGFNKDELIEKINEWCHYNYDCKKLQNMI